MANMIQSVIGSTGYEHFYITKASSGSGGGGTVGTCAGTVTEGFINGSLGSISVPRYRNMIFQSITNVETFIWDAENAQCLTDSRVSTINFNIGTNVIDRNFLSRIEMYSGKRLLQTIFLSDMTYLGSGSWSYNGFANQWLFGDQIRIYY